MIKCTTKYCTRKARKGRKICVTCKSRKYRQANPVRAAYNALKSNAKRRGKTFTLTFDQFAQFCRETEYIAGKGRRATSFTIDRRDNDEGYTLENIRVLTLSENAAKGKGRKMLTYDWETGYASVSEYFPKEKKDTDIF